MSDGMFSALGTAVGTYFGMPQVGAAVGSALDGAGNREKADAQRGDRYQIAVRDMMAAGLNPMLAYSQGGAPSNASTSSPDVGGHITASNAQELQRQMQAPQIENIKAQTLNTQASTAESVSRTNNNMLQAELLKAQAVNERERLYVLRSESPKNEALTFESHQRGDKLRDVDIPKGKQELKALIARYPEEMKLLVEQVRGAMWTNNASELDLSRREAESSFWSSETGKMKPYVDAVLPSVNSAGSLLYKLGPGRFGR